MKKYISVQLLIIALTASVAASSQVLIADPTEDQTIENGAILELKSENKGLLIPRVLLQSRNDVTTIGTTLVEGLWIYNTSNLGTGVNRVSPGFYFWDGTRWEKMFNDGFTTQFEQTETVRAANTTTTYTIPGLDQNFVAPYTGTYEIHITGYIAAANTLDPSIEATVIGSYILEIDNLKIAESMVSSNTKLVPGAFQALGRQTTIVHIADFIEGDTYNLKVRARLWSQENVDPNSLNLSSICGGAATGYAFFGVCTAPYNGNDISTVDNAQDAYLTINLLRQF